MAHSNLVEEMKAMDNLKQSFMGGGKPTYDGLQTAFCVKN